MDFKTSRVLPLLGMVAMGIPAAWVAHNALAYTHVSSLFPIGAAVFASGWAFVFMFILTCNQRRGA